MSDNPTSGTTPTQVQDRVIRVFISSTFRDMMRERDLLVKEVFPELRRKCAKRFVTFTEVDLRWGITEAQANEGQVLPLCLAEIERSRPYLIGLLGERYGWIPETIRPEVIAREPWLREHVQGRTSVTEMEILHGVLNNPKMADHAFFYFRDPAYVNAATLTNDERWDMVEHDIRADVERYGPIEATRRTEERKAKLAALKQRIRASKLPLVEPYANPKALAEIVRRQFDELIDHLYPEDQTPDLLAHERMAHEAHANNKLFACIDRPVHLAALNAFAAQDEHDGKGLVVTGESGGGKTALLAAWARDWGKNHPEDFLFQHYFGATPDSASPEGFLRRLLGEFKSRFRITDDMPTDPEKIRDALPVWLAQTIGKGRIVLVLDGLNHVQGSEPDRRLLFLPHHFPPHVAVLASALPSPALDALHERGWREHVLPHASEFEVSAMVDEYLNIHARSLEPELRHDLVTAPGAKNPLFLRTVLEELRQFGSFERLPQRVRHYLKADTPKDLFLRVIPRWQEDFDSKDPEQDKPKLDLVRRALTHLWAARQGLSEAECLDLLGDGSTPLPRAFWTPLFLAVEPHLSQRGGLFAFGHDFLRQAVETAFVRLGDLQKAAHLSIADYFEYHPHQRQLTPRKAAEWPHQLHAAESWERLKDCLADIPTFLALYGRSAVEWQWELLALWIPLRERYDAGKVYRDALLTWEMSHHDDEDVLRAISAVALFHYIASDYQSCEPLLRRALSLEQRLRGHEHHDVGSRLNELAQLLHNTHRLRESERTYRRALTIDENIFGPGHPNVARDANNLAVLMMNMKKCSEAKALILRALAIDEEAHGPHHPTVSRDLFNLGLLASTPAEQESLVRRALAIDVFNFGPIHPEVAHDLATLAATLNATNRRHQAITMLRQAVDIVETTCGPDHQRVVTYRLDLAVLLQSAGRLVEAAREYRRALACSDRGPNAAAARMFPARCGYSVLLTRLYCRGQTSLARPDGNHGHADPAVTQEDSLHAMTADPESLLAESKRVMRGALITFWRIKRKPWILYPLYLVAAAQYALTPVWAWLGVSLQRSIPWQRRLVTAIREGDNDLLIQSILSTCPNVNAKLLPDGSTALFMAADNGHADLVKMLIRSGANVDAKRTDVGATALIVAIQGGHGEVVEELLVAGADVNAAMTDGSSPVFMAAQQGHDKLLRLLIAKGADVNAAKTPSGATALMVAVQNDDASIVKLLIEANADVNARLITSRFPAGVPTLAIAKSQDVRTLLRNAGATL